MSEGASGAEPSGDRATIVAEDVVVRYGQVLALDNLTVSVPKGTVGLLGPNGAGKSTFIKTVLGLVVPQGGRVQVCGLDSVRDRLEIRDRVGYMPEHDCLVDTMSGAELVSYMGRLSGMSKRDAIPRSHEVLDFVGLGEERYRPVASYSTGMKQRVKLAQAIVHDPEVLFLDEPTNGMDPLGREEMLDLIGRIASSDKSILVSSHILQDVEKVCRNVVIANGGRVVTQGRMDVLLSQGRGRRRLKARGRTESLRAFIDDLGRENDIISVSEEFGQVTVVLVNGKSSGGVFESAARSGVQVRSYVPDRMTLEEVFLGSMKGVQ